MTDFKQLSTIVYRERDRLWKQSPELELQSLWSKAAGDQIAAQTRVCSLRNGTLVVRCSSGAWACELGLSATELAGRLNRLAPPERVRRIRFVHQARTR